MGVSPGIRVFTHLAGIVMPASGTAIARIERRANDLAYRTKSQPCPASEPMLVPGPVFVYRTCHRGIADLRIPTMTPETPRSTLICVDNGGPPPHAIAVRGGRFFRAKAITTAHDLSQCFIESLAALSREI